MFWERDGDSHRRGDVLKGSKATKLKSSPKVGSEAVSAAAPKRATDRLVQVAVILTPALSVAVLAPTAFLPALEYSGTLRLVLFGMMPAIMVWKVRYGGGKANSPPWVAGGKMTLAFVIAFASGIISLELGGKIFRALARV